MNRTRPDNRNKTYSALTLLQAVILVLCLCLLVLRACYTESPHTSTINDKQIFSNSGLSLIISSSMLFACALWLLGTVTLKQILWRKTFIFPGLALFITAGFVTIFFASNKRLAINDLVTLTAPALAAVVLVQILDSPAKIRLVLLTLTASAVLACFQCADQMFSLNTQLIENYEQNRQKQLEMIGAEPGSLKEFQFEHRLYSRDIRGFLTTSNSTGSFLLLAGFAVVGLFIDRIRSSEASAIFSKITFGIAAAIIITGLALTQSKGAIAAAMLAAVFFVLVLIIRHRFYKYRLVFIICLAIVLSAVAAAAISYGLKHGRLPGGNSMLVRWQYWTGAVQMYIDHPITGTGGGNFANIYPQYKIPAASESVHDPHNFILSLLTQYGPIGLLGFMAAFLLPIYKTLFAAPDQVFQELSVETPLLPASYRPLLLAAILTLLLVRPFFIAAEYGDKIDVAIYVYIILYLLPAVIFAIALWLLATSDSVLSETKNTSQTDSLRPALCAGLIAVAVHNVIDFALFEPAVLTAFWFTIACLVADGNIKTARPVRMILPALPLRIAFVVTVLLVIGSLFHYALLPVLGTGSKIQSIFRNPAQAQQLLPCAAADDPFDPEPLNLLGKFSIQKYLQGAHDVSDLNNACEYFSRASRRDRADFKYHESLLDAFSMLAEHSPEKGKAIFLHKALDAGSAAVERYPGSDNLHFKLAVIAENLNLTEKAIEHYSKSVEIEDAYRQQFRIMYPQNEILSRLGEQRYRIAKEKIAGLSHPMPSLDDTGTGPESSPKK